MTNPPGALDQMQASVDAVIREHNAITGNRKIHVAWGYREKETELREKEHQGTPGEIREALLSFDGDEFEALLSLGRPDRPGLLSIHNNLEVLPLPTRPEAIVGVLRDACAPMMKVDLLPGEGEDEGRLLAVAISTCVFVEGLTARALVTLLEDLSMSARLVSECLERAGS
jgi:hypothetical protein